MEYSHAGGRQERDLVLPPNTYAFVLDRTKGKVSAYVGPYRSSLSDTDHLVVWRNGKFIPESAIENSIQPFVEAGEGQYIVLANPNRGESDAFPAHASMNDAVDLQTGRKVVIPGPATFPLWPGQSAQVIDGHHLRHNQYLVVRVYEPEAAKANAGSAQVAPQTGEGADEAPVIAQDFTMGQLMVIRGTNVSFYMPSTGIEVVPEQGATFVREAATLEQLEYCILLDENGAKRFERGPAVVFPAPTETFQTEEGGRRKFKAIELNQQSGLYIKVIASYTENGKEYKEGDELFLTGADTPIYFPRAEHSLIYYGNNRKHHAIAVPEGEGRYVLDRTKGKVDLVRGPAMFLPDPRTEVIVRRILDLDTVAVMYPGNTEAQQINETYLAEQAKQADEAQGFEDAGEYLRGGALQYRSAALAATPGVTRSYGGERMKRGTEYTPPRTITLDTKYEGAVAVSVWPGYSVLVMNKSGHRRVEVGPCNILLEYDESLMVLSLSTGRPKTDDRKLRTPYLRTVNNSVSDEVTVETRDLVPVTLRLALRVNFEGAADTSWFDVEDYVALLTDHCRSKLRNLAKRHDIQEFYSTTIDLIRDALLGMPEDGSRPGLPFTENSMRLYDVEVLEVKIEHSQVEQLLANATDTALRGAIQLSEAEQQTERHAALEALKRTRLAAEQTTRQAEADAAIAGILRAVDNQAAEARLSLDRAAQETQLESISRAENLAEAETAHAILRERNEIEIERLKEETAQLIERAKAMDPVLVQAITNFGDKAFMETMMKAIAPIALATGSTAADTFKGVFKGTPFEGILDALTERPYAIAAPNGDTTERGRS